MGQFTILAVCRLRINIRNPGDQRKPMQKEPQGRDPEKADTKNRTLQHSTSHKISDMQIQNK